jgi:hypothetical protein
VVIDAGVCVGVQMEDGRVIRAEQVVSNVGAANTFERLVRREDAELIRAPLTVIRDLKWSSYAIIQVFMGFEGTAEDLGVNETSYWFLPKSLDHTDNAVKYFLDASFTSDFPYVHLTFPTAKSKTVTHTVRAPRLPVGALARSRDTDGVRVRGEPLRLVQGHAGRGRQGRGGRNRGPPHPKDVRALPQAQGQRGACFGQRGSRGGRARGEGARLTRGCVQKFIELATPLAHEFHLGAARGAPLGLGCVCTARMGPC